MEPTTSNRTISVQKLQGANERARFGVGELGEFDELVGFYTPHVGMLQQVPGKLYLQHFDSPVRAIFQTNDSRQNILIQTDANVYLMSEADFFNRSIVTNLTPAPTTEEEDMAQAIIIHSLAAVNTGGGSTTSNTFVTAPLNATILSQFNADGTAAAFASIAANVITLTSGWYRIRGWTLASDTSAATPVLSRLFNTGTALPLWNGLANENSEQVATVAAGRNVKMEFGGVFHAVGATTIRLETKMIGVSRANTGLGNTVAAAGTNDIYRWIEILRTGS